MRIIRSLFALWPVLMLTPAICCAAPQTADTAGAVALAQKQITAYLTLLADLHCTETVTQEKLNSDGHVIASEHNQFDYLIMISGNADGFQLNESRVEAARVHRKLVAMPMLITNGVATLLLVFHPYYRDGFIFEGLPEEMIDGRPALPVHFSQVLGRRTPAALALRGREYPLNLEGTAWLDEGSKEVLKVEASLEREMSDVGLTSLKIHVEYKPILLPGHKARMNLPSLAIVEVATPRQRWRNTHTFHDYKGFSTDVEQDPNIKIHEEKTASDGNKPADIKPQGARNRP